MKSLKVEQSKYEMMVVRMMEVMRRLVAFSLPVGISLPYDEALISYINLTPAPIKPVNVYLFTLWPVPAPAECGDDIH